MVVSISKEDNFNKGAADFLENRIRAISNEKDKVFIALSGGSTPIPILELLRGRDLDWERLYFFMVDERTVALSDPDSNYGAIGKVFLSHIPSQSFSMIQDNYSIKESIFAYEAALQNIVDFNEDGFPVFDLILLGMGNDGHTASLFPGTLALNEDKKAVVENNVPQLGAKRITLIYPSRKNAKQIAVIIRSESKKRIYKQIISNKQTDYPMQKIVSERSDLGWIIED